MINATYTDILAEIRDFFAQHLLVNSFIDGQLYDFQAKENVYSAVVLVPMTSQIQNTQLNLALDLYFVDRINEDGSNTRDIYNDELQIVQDFIAYFSNRRDTWNLDPENINIEPFEQKFADLLGGWRLSVSVLLPFYKNVCDIPLDEDAPVPPVPPTPPTPPVYRRDHAQLRNLDYEHAGHTGFQKALSSDNAGNNITITHDAQGNAIINAQVPSAAVWGNITGDLEDQTDLYNLLQLLDQATSDNAQAITTINGKIPAQATSDNQLADKAFVNSSIATSTATFKGTVTAANDTETAAQSALSTITGMDDNDYAFVVVPNTPQTGVDKYKRYKYNGSAWVYEYTLNNSSFTANQWAAINSGITSGKVTQYDDYATSKQDTLIAGTGINIDANNEISVNLPDLHRVIEFQAPTAENNYTWYRKYADGWVEQGTRLTPLQSASVKYFNFPVRMANTGYTITGTMYLNTGGLNINYVPYVREFLVDKVGVKISTTTPSYTLIYFIEVKGMYATE